MDMLAPSIQASLDQLAAKRLPASQGTIFPPLTSTSGGVSFRADRHTIATLFWEIAGNGRQWREIEIAKNSLKTCESQRNREFLLASPSDS